ncbi:MAG: glutathione S-transferase N-terminal domain-containing protein [Burkholderiales bacterium]|nr:glutathione S-transferase N-terminal domain-containing protein [Burkholderiales bacterium]
MILYELGAANGARYSSFSWRTRMALKHKGVAFDTVPVRVSDKAAIAFSGQGRVPILRDGDVVVSDSWKIAEHLEAAHRGGASLFGAAAGHALTRLVNAMVDRHLMAALAPACALSVTGIVDAGDAAHLRAGFEKGFGQTLEALHAGRAGAVKAFRRALDPVRAVLRAQPYLAGAAPAYADYILMSPLQWARIVDPEPVLEADDAVAAWFERMLDLFDGFARAEPARAARA